MYAAVISSLYAMGAKPYDASQGDAARIGDLRVRFDSNGLETVELYAYGHAALTVGVPYVLRMSGTEARRFLTAAPATLANEYVCVSDDGTAAAGDAWVVIAGKVTDAVTSGSNADTDLVEVLNTGVVFVCDGTTASTAWSANTCGALLEAQTSNVADLFLFGRQVDIAAT